MTFTSPTPHPWDTIGGTICTHAELRCGPRGLGTAEYLEEVSMRRLVGVLAVALVTAAVPSFVSAQGKTMNATGTVSAVAPDTLTVKGSGTESWTFMIEKDTSVIA